MIRSRSEITGDSAAAGEMGSEKATSEPMLRTTGRICTLTAAFFSHLLKNSALSDEEFARLRVDIENALGTTRRMVVSALYKGSGIEGYIAASDSTIKDLVSREAGNAVNQLLAKAGKAAA